MTSDENPDLLNGLGAIAKHLGLTRRQAKHRVEKRLIPTFKQGRTVCALRSKVDAALKEAADGK